MDETVTVTHNFMVYLLQERQTTTYFLLVGSVFPLSTNWVSIMISSVNMFVFCSVRILQIRCFDHRITANQGFYILGLYYASPTFASAMQNSVPAITFVMASALG